jgi:hypothetical protein
LAIYSEGQEDVVRDPIGVTEDGALVFVSQVPENAQIYLLTGDPHSMMRAVRQSLERLRLPPDVTPQVCLTIECFTRTLSLGEHFSSELGVIAERLAKVAPGLGVEGILALGEIAGDGERALEIHNKTVVVDLIHG